MTAFTNKFDLSGRKALVTGASGGLGEHFARLLAAQGAHVVLAARRVSKLEALADEIKSAGGAASAVSMDVTDPASVSAAFESFDTPCDIIINNSGVGGETWIAQTSEEAWSQVIDTNLTGVWRVAKEAIAALKAAGKGGSIVNIASITGLRPALSVGAYTASKAAVDHFTRTLAVESARFDIRVNALAPGYYKTAINEDFLMSEPGQKMQKRVPMRRFGEHEELDGALMLLASDAGSYMTGTTLVVDGGHIHQPL